MTIRRQPPPIRRTLANPKTGDVTKMWAQFFDGLVKELAEKQPVGTSYAVTSDYTITDNDGYNVIEVSTGGLVVVITLPTLAGNFGREITITKTDIGGGYIIVDGEGAETINGAATQTIANQFSAMRLRATSTQWVII